LDKKMIEWHEAVRAKYNNICQGCKRWFPDNMLCSHHIKSKGACPELKYDISNGICLDAFCHHEVHKGNLKVIGENEVIKN